MYVTNGERKETKVDGPRHPASNEHLRYQSATVTKVTPGVRLVPQGRPKFLNRASLGHTSFRLSHPSHPNRLYNS